MLKTVTDNGTLIALVGSFEDSAWGNNFLTQNELPMQLGVMRVNKQQVQDHIHKIRNRQVKSISNEFHYVVRGKVLVRLFNYEKKLIEKIMLCPNMFCLLFNGGHGFEIIKDDTLILEIKNGSFTTVAEDKEKIGEVDGSSN